MQIEPVGELAPQAREIKAEPTSATVSAFTEALRELLRDMETTDAQAAEVKRRLLTGEPVELHEVLLAVEKAHLSFQTFLSVRNRLLEAYQELTRMPL